MPDGTAVGPPPRVQPPLPPYYGPPPPPFYGPPPRYGPPYYGPRPLPPQPRRPIALRLTLALVALMVLCGTPAIWAASQIDFGALGNFGDPGSPGGAGGPGPTGVRSPQPGDPAYVRTAWVSAQIDATLDRQTQALLSGDEKAFVAAGESGMSTELKRRFTSLRAMKVASWDPIVVNGPTEATGKGGRSEWETTLSLRHCFVVAECETDSLVVRSRWVESGGRALLVSMTPSGDSEHGPRPWEVSELQAAAGERAVVATTARYASRLPTLLREADKAAAIADRYVVGADKPDRYRVYFAGSEEWKKWYGGDRPAWTAGYAVSISNKRMEVVLNGAEVPSSFLDDILRHELTHVASLRGAKYQRDSNWWLSEGLADHALLYGQTPSRHDALTSGVARRFLRAGKWDGKATIAEPDADAPLWEAVARYGIAFLAVRRMSERFGDAKLLTFFREVMHEGSALDDASRTAFGVSWSDVEGDCARSIRSRIG